MRISLENCPLVDEECIKKLASGEKFHPQFNLESIFQLKHLMKDEVIVAIAKNKKYAKNIQFVDLADNKH